MVDLRTNLVGCTSTNWCYRAATSKQYPSSLGIDLAPDPECFGTIAFVVARNHESTNTRLLLGRDELAGLARRLRSILNGWVPLSVVVGPTDVGWGMLSSSTTRGPRQATTSPQFTRSEERFIVWGVRSGRRSGRILGLAARLEVGGRVDYGQADPYDPVGLWMHFILEEGSYMRVVVPDGPALVAEVEAAAAVRQLEAAP